MQIKYTDRRGKIVSYNRTEQIQQGKEAIKTFENIHLKINNESNEKPISLLQEYNTYDYSHSKSCSGEMEYNQFRDTYSCSKCSITKSKYRPVLISSKMILAGSTHKQDSTKILEHIQDLREISKRTDIDDILFIRQVVENAHKMLIENVPNPRTKPTEQQKEEAIKIDRRINYLDFSKVYSQVEPELIKNEFELKKENNQWNLTKSSKIVKNLEEVNLSRKQSEDFLEFYKPTFKTILKMVMSGTHATIKTIDQLKAEHDKTRTNALTQFKSNATRQLNNKIREDIEFADNQQKLKLIETNKDDLLLMRNSELSQSIQSFFKGSDKTQRVELNKINAELQEYKDERFCVEAELRHWINQPDYDFAKKRIPELRNDIKLIEF